MTVTPRRTIPPGPGRLRTVSVLAAAWAILIFTACADPVLAVTHLARGMQAPGIALNTIDGLAVNTDDLRGQAVVLIFGELYHGKTAEACDLIRTTQADERLRDEPVTTLLIVAQQTGTDDLKDAAADNGHVPETILHDPGREAFGDYRVTVLPSVVVVDEHGRVVHVIAGLTTGFADRLADALLLATGKITAETFDSRRRPQDGPVLSENEVKAIRLTQLAGQLSNRGMAALAEEKYTEALELSPANAPAHLGMGMLQLKRGRLAEAEKRFRKVMELDPDSVEASLGLAYVMTMRGDEELASAEKLTRRVLALNPAQPRAHYLLGLIQQQGGDIEAAAASFKKSAELLLDRYEQEASP